MTKIEQLEADLAASRIEVERVTKARNNILGWLDELQATIDEGREDADKEHPDPDALNDRAHDLDNILCKVDDVLAECRAGTKRVRYTRSVAMMQVQLDLGNAIARERALREALSEIKVYAEGVVSTAKIWPGYAPIAAMVDRALAAAPSPACPSCEMGEVRIVLDGPPGHDAGRFVEVEDANGRSINAGEWVKRNDGYWELRILAALAHADGTHETKEGK